MNKPYQCTICLDTTDDTEFQRLNCTPITTHTFHEQCLITWSNINPTCPLCTTHLPFLPNPQILRSLINFRKVNDIQDFINNIPADNAKFVPLINNAIEYTRYSLERLNYPWCFFSAQRHIKRCALATATSAAAFYLYEVKPQDPGANISLGLLTISTVGALCETAYNDYSSHHKLIYILNLLEAYKNLHDSNN